MGAAVVIVGRNPQKCRQVQAEIRQETGNPAVDHLVADLSSQAEIRRLAAAFSQRYTRLDVLVNNAGAAFLTRTLSDDGIEKTFALNHLGYFLLTRLLLDLLITTAPARIVNVSSGNHFGKRLDFQDLQLARRYNPLEAYGRSKLANILFTYELSRRLEGTGVTANALNPGLVATHIWMNAGPLLGPLVSWWVGRRAQTPAQGAQGLIYLASAPELTNLSGRYFNKKVEIKSDPVTYDPAVARQLWQISAQMTGLDEG